MQSIQRSVGNKAVNNEHDVRTVQVLLNKNNSKIAPLALLVEDGDIGPRTIEAISEFQRRVVGMNRPDGRVDPGGGTLRALNQASAAATAAPANRTAVFERTSKADTRRQMKTGRITINGTTYTFRSGGHGRGNLPVGNYTVTPHLWKRSENGFSVDGVGFSFAVSDKYDPRVEDTRTLLRIHPDGGSVGTNGCIGIVGDGKTQIAFRKGMRAEFNRSNNSVSLTVR